MTTATSASKAQINWDAKLEAHNNLYLVHTRNDDVRDCIEDSGLTVQRYGTAYIIDFDYANKLAQHIRAAGFTVSNSSEIPGSAN
jgi:hypothetical protein